MNRQIAASDQSNERTRAVYEAPAIEESAGFETLALGCNMTMQEQPDLCLPMANSSPL